MLKLDKGWFNTDVKFEPVEAPNTSIENVETPNASIEDRVQVINEMDPQNITMEVVKIAKEKNIPIEKVVERMEKETGKEQPKSAASPETTTSSIKKWDPNFREWANR